MCKRSSQDVDKLGSIDIQTSRSHDLTTPNNGLIKVFPILSYIGWRWQMWRRRKWHGGRARKRKRIGRCRGKSRVRGRGRVRGGGWHRYRGRVIRRQRNSRRWLGGHGTNACTSRLKSFPLSCYTCSIITISVSWLKNVQCFHKALHATHLNTIKHNVCPARKNIEKS